MREGQPFTDMTRPEVLFLVSPNFGLLDSWLPVLVELKRRRPDAAITAVIPKPSTALEIHPSEVTIQIAESIFDGVVFKSRSGSWVRAESFARARELAKAHRITNFVIGKVRAAFGSRGTVAPFGPNVRAICFDIFAKMKRDCRAFLDLFPETPRFSILHGIAVADYHVPGGAYDKGSRRYPVTAYVHSAREVPAYRENYGLADSEIKVVGVPRHERAWMERLAGSAVSDVPESWDRYIFVISRPAMPSFFPREVKRQALEDVRRLAREDLHAQVVIKMHPTELVPKHRDGIAEAVFGKDSYGKDWVYSSAHPFALGKRSILAVTFYSGVCVDMLALGVSTVERTVMTPEAEGGKKFIVDFAGRGLVLGAKNYRELKAQALRIRENASAVLKALKPNYDALFVPIGSPIKTIAEDIFRML